MFCVFRNILRNGMEKILIRSCNSFSLSCSVFKRLLFHGLVNSGLWKSVKSLPKLEKKAAIRSIDLTYVCITLTIYGPDQTDTIEQDRPNERTCVITHYGYDQFDQTFRIR